jgi:hypothetical protein
MVVRLDDDFYLKQPHRPFYLASKASVSRDCGSPGSPMYLETGFIVLGNS